MTEQDPATTPSTETESLPDAVSAPTDPLMELVAHAVRVAVRRYHRYERKGIVDPEYARRTHVNPRFQETALLLALAGTHRVAVPEGMRPPDLLTMALRVVDVWLREVQRNGAVRVNPNGNDDPQATAYGLYAASRTLQLLSNQIPTIMRRRAERTLRRSARFLQRAFLPSGPDTRPLRFAAIQAAAEWLDSSSLKQVAAHIKRDADSVLRENVRAETFPDDAGAYALALAYLTLETPDPTPADLDVWGMIVERCAVSTTPTGLMGGGAEISIASLPILTGFGRAAAHLAEAKEYTRVLERAWRSHWYDGLLDTDVPWLAPMSALLLEYRIACPFQEELGPLSDPSSTREHVLGTGAGLRRMGDWLLRLAPGGTIGWLHHVPTGSTRLFGSPVGSALREGPWVLEGSRMRHPALTGQFEVEEEGERLVVEGKLHSASIPGVSRTPRRVGFPILRGQNTRDLIRLAPPHKAAAMRLHNPVDYRREIELKDGALTIETFLDGRITHRLPVIWPGGPFGRISVGKSEAKMGTLLQERRVREVVFGGGPWPDWVLRFDRPVDVLHEPFNIAITHSPMRYLTAGCSTLDIMTDDRLHMAWRVVD